MDLLDAHRLLQAKGEMGVENIHYAGRGQYTQPQALAVKKALR